jgi:O-antigen ligase
MGLLFIQKLSLRQALAAMVLGCSLIVIVYEQSPVMQNAVHRGVSDYKLYKNNEKDTAIGWRFQFHDYAHKLFKQHPWFGNGTASFTHRYAEDKPVPSWDRKLLEPHSQYWLIASEYGVAGCFALALFFGTLLYSSWFLQTLKPLALAILLPFFLGNLSDSLLFYSGTGYYFILFMALCLGEQARRREPAPIST